MKDILNMISFMEQGRSIILIILPTEGNLTTECKMEKDC